MEPPENIDQIYAELRKKQGFFWSTTATEQQRPFLRDIPAKGPVWVSRITIPGKGNQGLLEAVHEVAKKLGDGTETYEIGTSEDVGAEWVGCRPGAEKSVPEPQVSEEEKYKLMMKDVKSDMVMLYAHGGAAVTGSAASSRLLTSRLAALTGARALSINYRLSPQHVFPAQLIDLLVTYLWLLYPPPGSLHSAIHPSEIVLIGDSFGGTLSLALIQLLLNFPPSAFDSPIPLPAGIALVSPYSHNPFPFPSWTNNAILDTFPLRTYPHYTTTTYPSCSVWPSSPPRSDMYCTTALLSHPLVAPCAAKSWKGCPPMYLASGTERCIDSAAVVAKQAVKDGVSVQWEVWDRMCHVWMLVFPKWRQSLMVMQRWADAASGFAEGTKVYAGSEGRFMMLRGGEKPMTVGGECDITPDDAKEILEDYKRQRKDWTGPTEMKSAL